VHNDEFIAFNKKLRRRGMGKYKTGAKQCSIADLCSGKLESLIHVVTLELSTWFLITEVTELSANGEKERPEQPLFRPLNK
jgi:hypothetical protein